jgi:DNA-binding CsgD family transcriptional regulator
MHVRNALSKLECRTRTEASSRAIALGLIDPMAPVSA